MKSSLYYLAASALLSAALAFLQWRFKRLRARARIAEKQLDISIAINRANVKANEKKAEADLEREKIAPVVDIRNAWGELRGRDKNR